MFKGNKFNSEDEQIIWIIPKPKKPIEQNKNFLIEIAFGKAEMKLKVVTKLINTIEIQFNDQFFFISNEILDYEF